MEKLLKQVGDKETEIDTLIKLTKEDLWTRDLDDFLAEWRFQLDDEEKRQKKVANMGRRGSRKLKIAGGVAGRKRKNDSDDDDFDVAPVKAKKSAMPKKEVGGLLSYMMPDSKTKTSPKPKAKAQTATQKAAKKALDLISAPAREEDKDDVWMNLDNLDGSASDVPVVTKPRAAPPKVAQPVKNAEPARKKIESDDDEEEIDEEIVRPTASRRPRGAAAKPISYNVDSDSDGDGMLFDVGKMVKGIDTASAPADNSRPLFSASMSRPSSSAGIPKRSTSSKPAMDIDSDDTNYSKLAPPTTNKGPAVTARKTILSDDEDDSLDDIIIAPPKASKPAPKAAAKPGPKPKAPPKKATKAAAPPAAEPKKMPLSPAAKAYAAKKAKAEKAALKANSPSDDELEGLANEIMDGDDDDDDEDAGPAVRRPARRAASAAPKKKWVISDDEDELELEESTMQFDDGDSDE